MSNSRIVVALLMLATPRIGPPPKTVWPEPLLLELEPVLELLEPESGAAEDCVYDTVEDDEEPEEPGFDCGLLELSVPELSLLPLSC